ncbi:MULTISPECIES: glycoside hydrolase family 16 protein [Pseudonocardia]|uniref:glycoside hydrolase family 16 protein n=1 Tax=Pseudonocardia TaxID=1847 RepID=UPI001AD70054|nr:MULTISPECIES: glycoside hydrolase family 16 protein [Pseudonocardia]MBO4241548.1 family 16 glycosylhydrolase [Pseudonocardia alni]
MPEQTEQEPEHDPEAPTRRRWPAVVGIVAGLAVLAGVVTVATDPSLLTGSSTPTPAPSAPATPPGGMHDQERPTEVGELDPAARSDTEAAVRNGWRLTDHDEFDGAALDRTRWSPYTGETTGGNGRHLAENISVRNGELVLTSRGRTSAGLAWRGGQQYGRWEIRAKTNPAVGYGDVALLWPDAEDWPEGGELNFMEIPKPQRDETHTIVHYGEDNSQVGKTVRGDFTQWHTFAVEWLPDRVVFYIDGAEVFRTTDPEQIPPRSMHLAMQQDIGPYGDDWIPAPDATTPDSLDFQVDWVRIYAP